MSLYDILQVQKNASKEEIESAFKRIAKRVHPVINKKGDTDFVELNRAYSILKDDYKRDFYDVMGDNSINMLDSEKDSYLMVRMFDRQNIICYFSFLLVLSVTVLAFPLLMYYDKSEYGLYSITALNFLLIIPLLRNLFRLSYKTFKQITYLTFRYLFFSSLLYFRNSLVILFLVFCDTLNIFIIIESYVLSEFIISYTSFFINLVCILLIKIVDDLRISVPLVYLIIHLYPVIMGLSRFILVIVCSFILMYFIPVFCIIFEKKSQFIFIPLYMLMLMFLCILLFIIYFMKSNIPGFSPSRRSLESMI
jgi:hypothetical protein